MSKRAHLKNRLIDDQQHRARLFIIPNQRARSSARVTCVIGKLSIMSAEIGADDCLSAMMSAPSPSDYASLRSLLKPTSPETPLVHPTSTTTTTTSPREMSASSTPNNEESRRPSKLNQIASMLMQKQQQAVAAASSIALSDSPLSSTPSPQVAFDGDDGLSDHMVDDDGGGGGGAGRRSNGGHSAVSSAAQAMAAGKTFCVACQHWVCDIRTHAMVTHYNYR